LTPLFKLKGNDDTDHDDDGDHDAAIVVVDDDDCNDADVIEGGMLLIYLSIIIFYRNIPSFS